MKSVSFGSLCDLRNGRAFKPEEWSDQGTPIVRIQNLNDESKPFNYCNFEVEEKFWVNSGDLLFSWSGTPGTSFGAFFWNRGRGFLNQHIFRVDINETLVDKAYLRYALNSLLDKIIDQSHGGVGLKHITKAKLESVQIPLPPLPEQRRIAAILDKADALRTKRREAIAKLDQLLQSVFLEMFGDPVTNSKGSPETDFLGDVADICSGITKGRRTTEKTRETPYLAVANVQDRHLKLGSVKTICATDAEIERYRLAVNDLLLTEGGDPDKLGRGALWDGSIRECIHQNHVFRVRITSPLINPVFLNWLVGSARGKRYFLSVSKQTTGIASINMTQLKKFPLLAPPIALQTQFALAVSKIEVHKRELEKARDSAEQLFQALQQQAFTGTL
ncbi:MAG: restriction endonuclease subunit S [Pseudomonas sp.]|uniref:restriction endonuclease subunit S n=1 Tax=Pseudomonas sp. TaxID=306 RepID=UPI002733AE33|nr:restriction endonuclease subunit S [Pseudomonas sp.]MDP3847982.1 restriction endonuclease subunit S [Pseudomonas sp.]